MDKYKNKGIDHYISHFPKSTQILLKQLRAIINKAAPQAEEVISYNMPAYKYHGMLVYFAGYRNHIGFYPMSSAITVFKKELSVYKGAKGSVQFPLDKPLPIGLITKIVKFRVKKNIEKEKLKLKDNFLLLLATPARRALENKGIKTVKQLAKFSEMEILELHGMGVGSIPKLRNVLKSKGLSFKKTK